MAKQPRPMDKKLLPTWAKAQHPNDPTAQRRAIDAGGRAIDAAVASAEKNRAEMARRQNNRLKK